VLSDLAVDAEQGLRPCSRNPSSEMIDGLRRRILAGRRRLHPLAWRHQFASETEMNLDVLFQQNGADRLRKGRKARSGGSPARGLRYHH
jgi:hypothetical protein